MSYRGDKGRNAALVLDRLTHLAPMSLTLTELVEETGLSRMQIYRALPLLRDPENRRVRIAGWERNFGGGDVAPKYAIGSAPDARKIRSLTKSEYEKRRWARDGFRLNAIRRAKRNGAKATPFDGLMT